MDEAAVEARALERIADWEVERFIEEVRGDEPDVAEKLRIEERELGIAGATLELDAVSWP